MLPTHIRDRARAESPTLRAGTAAGGLGGRVRAPTAGTSTTAKDRSSSSLTSRSRTRSCVTTIWGPSLEPGASRSRSVWRPTLDGRISGRLFTSISAIRQADPYPLGRGRRLMETIRHTLVRFKRENMTDKAAGLTYYSVLSLFPAMLVLVALIGVLGQYPETTDKLLQIVQKLGPSSAVDTFRRPIEGIVRN